MELAQIEKRIKKLEQEYEKCKGTPTEVYSRIVGYFRAVTNWNKGKREEFKERVNFTHDEEQVKKRKKSKPKTEQYAINPNIPPTHFLLFTNPNCRNCPPVEDYMRRNMLEGEYVDVMTADGIKLAQKYNIRATPTLILFVNDDIMARAYNIGDIEAILSIFSLQSVKNM